MTRTNATLIFSALLVWLTLSHCRQKRTEVTWSKSLPGLGSQSSPRATDLNGDGDVDLGDLVKHGKGLLGKFLR